MNSSAPATPVATSTRPRSAGSAISARSSSSSRPAARTLTIAAEVEQRRVALEAVEREPEAGRGQRLRALGRRVGRELQHGAVARAARARPRRRGSSHTGRPPPSATSSSGANAVEHAAVADELVADDLAAAVDDRPAHDRDAGRSTAALARARGPGRGQVAVDAPPAVAARATERVSTVRSCRRRARRRTTPAQPSGAVARPVVGVREVGQRAPDELLVAEQRGAGGVGERDRAVGVGGPDPVRRRPRPAPRYGVEPAQRVRSRSASARAAPRASAFSRSRSASAAPARASRAQPDGGDDEDHHEHAAPAPPRGSRAGWWHFEPVFSRESIRVSELSASPATRASAVGDHRTGVEEANRTGVLDGLKRLGVEHDHRVVVSTRDVHASACEDRLRRARPPAPCVDAWIPRIPTRRSTRSLRWRARSRGRQRAKRIPCALRWAGLRRVVNLARPGSSRAIRCSGARRPRPRRRPGSDAEVILGTRHRLQQRRLPTSGRVPATL